MHLLKIAFDWEGQGKGGGVERVGPTTASTEPWTEQREIGLLLVREFKLTTIAG